MRPVAGPSGSGVTVQLYGRPQNKHPVVQTSNVGRHDYDLVGVEITNYDATGARSVELAAGRGESHLWLISFEPGGQIGHHVAGFDQLFLVLRGDAWVDVDGEHIELGVGQAATISLGQVHAKGSLHGAEVMMAQYEALHFPEL